MFRYSALSDEEKKEVYDKWHGLINMSQSALDAWAEDDDRLLASINRQEAKEEGGIQSGYDSFHRIKRRKEKPFEDWSDDDFENAKQENGFNSRMLGGKPGQPVGDTKMSKWEISLRNWGHDPSLKSSPQYAKWKSWHDKNFRKKKASMKKTSCVIAFSEVNGKKFMFKNRDRNYVPQLKVYHTDRRGVEVVYFKDEQTGWVEGINEFGIAVANSALMVLWDEKEGAKGKGKNNSHLGAIGSKDAGRILKALESRDFDSALESVLTYDGGIRGHTFVSDGNRAVSVEHTAKHEAYITDLTQKDKHHVRSNHGIHYPDAGYTIGENKKSSHDRLQKVLELLPEINSPENLVERLYAQRFEDFNSPYNVVRRTDNMFTSSQLVYDFDERKITLYLIPEDCEYLGYEKDYEGKESCSFEVKRISHFDDDGSFTIRPVGGNPSRVASLKMARIPSVGNIKRKTCKKNERGKRWPRNKQNCDVWTEDEVETLYENWKEEKLKSKESKNLWRKYESAARKGDRLDPDKVKSNVMLIELEEENRAKAVDEEEWEKMSKWEKLKTYMGLGKEKEKRHTGLSPTTDGGDGDPAKKEKREEQQKARAERRKKKRKLEREKEKRKQEREKKREEKAERKKEREKKKASELDIFDQLALEVKRASQEIIDDIGLDDYLD